MENRSKRFGAVDLSEVVHKTPKQAGDIKGNLMLSEKARSIQEAGGTWVDLSSRFVAEPVSMVCACGLVPGDRSAWADGTSIGTNLPEGIARITVTHSAGWWGCCCWLTLPG